MEKLLVTFKVVGQLDTCNSEAPSDNLILAEIIEKFNQGGIVLQHHEPVHGYEFDNTCDNIIPVVDNHTLLEIRLDKLTGVDETNDAVITHVLVNLKDNSPFIAYKFNCGEPPLVKSIIGIEIIAAEVPSTH